MAQNMAMSKPGYQEILFDELKLDNGASGDHAKALRNRLVKVGEHMQEPINDFFGINQCLHIASSLVLLESNAERVMQTLPSIAQKYPELAGKDPSTVVTIAALYHLIKTAENNLKKSDKATIEYIHRRFDQMNWMIGEDGMRVLGIKTLL
jgi:hypothetical protein